MENISLSKKSAAKTVFAAFKILKENGGKLAGREVIEKIRQSVEFDEWELHIYNKTGYVRWQSIFHFYTIDCIKAGFLTKNKGIWYLTEEGEKAIKLGGLKLLEEAGKAYREWQKNSPKKDNEDNNDLPQELENNQKQTQKANLELLEEQAIAGIKEFINSKNPYEFQDIVASLLRAMGYYTPYVSPKGKDGGIDIIALKDPLGATPPRIKVQVKHRPEASIRIDDIRSLIGLLNKEGDVGLFVTSGKFTSDSERFARDSHIHVKIIDIDELIDLWQKHYSKLSDEEKNTLPLQPIYFLGSNE